MNKLFIVGDSTLCHYDDEPDRFIPRNGYGMWLHKYFKDLNVVNLALSGRSSKSFVSEDYYAKLLKEMGKGDYLLICFGHNDEKTDDRRTDPTMAVDDPASMSYWLYNYYVSKAKAVGATPIMVSSIVRRIQVCHFHDLFLSFHRDSTWSAMTDSIFAYTSLGHSAASSPDSVWATEPIRATSRLRRSMASCGRIPASCAIVPKRSRFTSANFLAPPIDIALTRERLP